MMSSVTMVVCAVSAFFLPGNEPVSSDVNLPSKEAFQSAIRPPLRTFFVANFFCGLGLGVYYILFPRFLQELGCSIVEVGLIINAGVLCEVVFMPFGRRLIDRFGLELMMLAGYATIPVRMLIMVLFPSIPVMIAVQLLHAPLALGVFVGTPIFLQQRADPSFRHSLQSLNSALVMGFTRFCGPLIASVVIGMSAGQPAIAGLSWALVVSGVLGLISTVIFYGVYLDSRKVGVP
jgi:MFS family permease